jgi:ABC-type lipoprotein release transport system permease subunit
VLDDARLLARGWRRGSRRWYQATTLVLAAALTVLLTASAVMGGIQQETRQRVGDFFTDELRVTPTPSTGAIPPGMFEDAPNAAAQLGPSERVRMQLESQFVVSRRGFIQAALSETEQFPIDAGGEGGGRKAIALGVVIGMDFGDEVARKASERHLVVGSLPSPSTGSDSMQLVMSLERFRRFLEPEEQQELTWPPGPDTLRRFRFDTTAATLVDNRTLADRGDILRRASVLVGLYETGVELLDSLTYLAPIEEVRRLLGHEPDAPMANVLLVSGSGGAVQRAHAAADARGWGAQDAGGFTEAHLGQLVRAVRTLTTLSAVSLFLVPAFLLLFGLTRQLETHQREIAVCRAIGVPARRIHLGLAFLAGRMTGIALLAAAVATTLLGIALHAWLPGQTRSPVPLDFYLEWTTILVTLVAGIGTAAAAWFLAVRAQGRQRVSEALRTF